MRLYGLRLLVLMAMAFIMSALLLPTFDLLMLGEWAGPVAVEVQMPGGRTQQWRGLAADRYHTLGLTAR